MAKVKFDSVDQYIASQPEAARGILKRVRSAIRKGIPEAEEVISYQIPTYKLPAGAVIYFAGWKKHFSLYPATKLLVAEFKDDLGPYELSKGTIRFPLCTPVPIKLVERIAKSPHAFDEARYEPLSSEVTKVLPDRLRRVSAFQ